MNDGLAIEIGKRQATKRGQQVCGDVFSARRVQSDGRVIAVLADGLGSGIKASVLAELTASMAISFAEAQRDMLSAVESIFKTLPVCQERGMAYSTLTVLELSPTGLVRMASHGNPPVQWLRESKLMDFPISRSHLTFPFGAAIQVELEVAEFMAEAGDRLLVMSDGITESGWPAKEVALFLAERLLQEPECPPERLSSAVVEKALAKEGGTAKDDMSCAVIQFRLPRHGLIITGPPFDRTRDSEMAEWTRHFLGEKVICGGTTASLLSRELSLPLTLLPSLGRTKEPPEWSLQGFSLVTEGSLTLTRLLDLLERGKGEVHSSPSGKLYDWLLSHDELSFVVGSGLNAAHYDPSLNREIDIRRNIVRRIAEALTTKHLKTVALHYL